MVDSSVLYESDHKQWKMCENALVPGTDNSAWQVPSRLMKPLTAGFEDVVGGEHSIIVRLEIAGSHDSCLLLCSLKVVFVTCAITIDEASHSRVWRRCRWWAQHHCETRDDRWLLLFSLTVVFVTCSCTHFIICYTTHCAFSVFFTRVCLCHVCVSDACIGVCVYVVYVHMYLIVSCVHLSWFLASVKCLW